MYSKTFVKQTLSKRPKIGFQDQLSLNAGQKYCRMLQKEHSAILLTFIKLPFVIKIFVSSIFEWPFYTGFTVFLKNKIAKRNKTKTFQPEDFYIINTLADTQQCKNNFINCDSDSRLIACFSNSVCGITVVAETVKNPNIK